MATSRVEWIIEIMSPSRWTLDPTRNFLCTVTWIRIWDLESDLSEKKGRRVFVFYPDNEDTVTLTRVFRPCWDKIGMFIPRWGWKEKRKEENEMKVGKNYQ